MEHKKGPIHSLTTPISTITPYIIKAMAFCCEDSVRRSLRTKARASSALKAWWLAHPAYHNDHANHFTVFCTSVSHPEF
ncbi:hypothetical protein NXX24_21135 [Bacteroides fragilis]|nr:hypothetical protein [Bacteroides fragilis]